MQPISCDMQIRWNHRNVKTRFQDEMKALATFSVLNDLISEELNKGKEFGSSGNSVLTVDSVRLR